MNAQRRARARVCVYGYMNTCNIGVLYYLLKRDRDLVRTIIRGRYLPLRGPPRRVPSACHPPQSSQTLTTSTKNTMVIQSEVLGFVLRHGVGRSGRSSDLVVNSQQCKWTTFFGRRSCVHMHMCCAACTVQMSGGASSTAVRARRVRGSRVASPSRRGSRKEWRHGTSASNPSTASRCHTSDLCSLSFHPCYVHDLLPPLSPK